MPTIEFPYPSLKLPPGVDHNFEGPQIPEILNFVTRKFRASVPQFGVPLRDPRAMPLEVVELGYSARYCVQPFSANPTSVETRRRYQLLPVLVQGPKLRPFRGVQT
jgi:hypothetical protein